MVIEIPYGWRIERQERTFLTGEEVLFKVVRTADEQLVTTTRAEAHNGGTWTVHPGASTSRLLPDEARARAAAIVMAADEAERRVHAEC